ncbi:MAG TPA: hypothetical protein PLZ78_09040 [Spirochaetota bacterium]|nr:hypothetical protein [Spirochaetota bacterium]
MIDWESILPKKRKDSECEHEHNMYGVCGCIVEDYNDAIINCLTALKQAEKDGKICEPLSVSPEQLHKWYLEATAGLTKENYNPKAQTAYEFLTDEQKSIDIYIADKINAALVAREGR